MSYECVCEPYSGDETWEWCREKIVAARKPYKCCECADAIKIGERHEYMVGKADGEIYQYRTCLFCAGEYRRLCNEGVLPVKGDVACWLVAELRGDL